MCIRCNSCGWEGTEEQMIAVPQIDFDDESMTVVLACPMCFEVDEIDED